MDADDNAPGAPGIPARWTSSAKNGVGTALSDRSRVWFTLSHGILNEIYYPRIDEACVRDFGFIVTNGKDFFSEEKRDTDSVLEATGDGVPAFTITSTCKLGRYRLRKLIFCDPDRDVLMQHIAFEPLIGARGDYRLYALVAPHLVNRGEHNVGWVEAYKGVPMVFAEGSGSALAVACSVPFIARSAGFVGASDGWQDLSRHFEMRWRYKAARDGNVALTAEVDLAAGKDGCVVALGFGRRHEEAALKVRASLSQGVDETLQQYVAGWRAWQKTLLDLPSLVNPGKSDLYRVSTAVLRTHEESAFAGGYIASLSIPWGFDKGANDLGGYHLVWPRDLVETAGGLLAAGAKTEARQIIDYLRGIQELDGHWPQNCWLDGTSYWTGVQMDETALPILLVDLAWREKALNHAQYIALWPMVRAAASYIVINGPVTGQDRWEEDGGYSPFTLAAEITALLAAADLADMIACTREAAYLRDTADLWNGQIEHWIYATETSLAVQVGVPGYYVRVAPAETADAASPLDGFVPIKNRPPEESRLRASLLVSPDALALVRFGLRAPGDPKILATIRVIDAQLKVDLPAGPCWRRYNGDGYGEHEDGRPFDGTGVGRPWPLLTGERAHYELAAGHHAAAKALLGTMVGFANDYHLIPEQVWDGPNLPERELFHGRPAGSAMPLVWAHAEHLKLLRSFADGRVFDVPPQGQQRYVIGGVTSSRVAWRPNHKIRSLTAGSVLRIERAELGTVRWSTDAWRSTREAELRDSGLGLYFVDLETGSLSAGTAIVFAFGRAENEGSAREEFCVGVRDARQKLTAEVLQEKQS